MWRRRGIAAESGASVTEPVADQHETREPDGAARRLSTVLLVAIGLVVVVLLLSLLSTYAARVPFVLQVNGTQATLAVDGRTLQSPWPQGITGVAPMAHPPNARLFQVDGTDTTGTQTFNPDTFAATAATPYYHFLCWMRDCADYSRWIDLSVRDDGTGKMLLTGGDGAALSRVVLPPRFTLRGALERPDLSGDLQFSGGASAQLGINPDFRQVYLQDQAHYYPFDPRPYLAEVGWSLTRSYLWSVVLLLAIGFAGLLLALGLGALGRRSLPTASIGRRLRRAQARALDLGLDRPRPRGAAAVILLVLLGISTFEYQQVPRLYDATAYYFQAKIISTGNLWVPVPPSAIYGFFSGPFMIHGSNGHWYGHYPPGTSLALALGLLVHLSWTVEPLLGAASVILMARLARRWYGRATTWLALLLLATSPFFLFLASAYLSHMVGLFALLLSLEGIDRLAATGDWRWAALAGFGAGYSVLTRELDTVLFLAPVVFFYAWRIDPLSLWRRLRAEPRLRLGALRVTAACGVPALLCLAFYFFFNWDTTGNALLTPRSALTSSDTWGFGPGHGWFGMHTVAAGLFVVENQLTALLIHLFGWPYYLTLGFFFLPLVTLRLRQHDVLLYSIAAIFLFGYGGYFYHGVAYGPRYIFASLPAYILLTARGLVVAAEIVTAALRRITPEARARAAGVTATALALAALCACNLTFYLPRQFSLYYDYLEQRADGGLGYDRIHPSWMHNAIVLTDDYGFYGDVLFPLNDPFLRGDIIYAFIPSPQNIKPLLDAYPHRAYYRLTIDQRHLQFVRMRVLHAPSHTVTLISGQSTAKLTGLAMDAQGNLYAADDAAGTILRVSATGAVLGAIATGVTPGAGLPFGIWRQALYWYDAATSTFWRADLMGGHRRSIALQPPCPACHTFAMAPNGDVIFSATANSALYRYSPRGPLLATANQQSLQQPVSLAVTADGHVFTYDIQRQRTFMFDPSLRLLGTVPFGSPGGDSSITLLAAHGDWLVGTDPGTGRLVAYDARTGALRDVMVNANGDLLAEGAFGLAWNGHQLALGTGSSPVAQVVPTGVAPF